MIRKFLLALLVSLSLTSAVRAAGPLGLGVVLIDPTGISGNYYYEKQKSIALGLGFGGDHLHLNVDHLWYRRDIIVIDRTPIDLYLGVGLRYYNHEYKHHDDDNDTGVRVPVGVAHIFRKIPVQVFGELAPALILVDETAFIIDLALGVRYYF